LAHNAPRLKGESQPGGNASVVSFDDQAPWAWVHGRFDGMSRMVMSGPAYLVDVVMFSGGDEQQLELPWHIGGRGSVETRGRWVDDALAETFVTRVQRFVPDEGNGTSFLVTHAHEGAHRRAHLLFHGHLLQLETP